MRPVSLQQIKALSDMDWIVTQKFEKLGKPVTVYGHGFSRKDALKNFEQEKAWAEMSETDFWQDLGNTLMNFGEWLDSVSTRIKAFLGLMKL